MKPMLLQVKEQLLPPCCDALNKIFFYTIRGVNELRVLLKQRTRANAAIIYNLKLFFMKTYFIAFIISAVTLPLAAWLFRHRLV